MYEIKWLTQHVGKISLSFIIYPFYDYRQKRSEEMKKRLRDDNARLQKRLALRSKYFYVSTLLLTG